MGNVIALAGGPVEFTGPAQAQSAGVSTVYQEINLCPNLSVVDNLFLGKEENLASARELNAELHKTFDESQIYRIDHFLGKEPVMDIVRRFGGAAPDDVHVLKMAMPAHADEGCLCSAHATVSALLAEARDHAERRALEDAQRDEERDRHVFYMNRKQGQLPNQIQREVRAAISILRERRPVPQFVESLGRIAHLVVAYKAVVGIHQGIFHSFGHQGSAELHATLVKTGNSFIQFRIAFRWPFQENEFQKFSSFNSNR